MLPENIERNTIIYEAWTKGYTIDEISFDTGIPRSTVGYYVRKFNKLAKKGGQISFQLERKVRDEKEMAELTVLKTLTRLSVMTALYGSRDEVDRLYIMLMCQKLINERKRDFFPTDAERNAFLNNYEYVVKQVIDVMAAVNADKTRMTPDSASVTIKEISDALVAHQEGLSLNAESEVVDVSNLLEQIKHTILAEQKKENKKPTKKGVDVYTPFGLKRTGKFSGHPDQKTIRRKREKKGQ